MRTSINLASQPYLDLRGEYRRWLAVSIGMAVLTIGLGIFAAIGLRQRQTIDAEIQRLSTQRDKLNAEVAGARQQMQEPGNVAMRERSQFLNDIILEKSFSWTRAFEELEKIMPAHAQVVSIQPELGPNRQLYIHLLVSGERDSAIELVRRLEKSSNFANPVLRSETATEGTKGLGVGDVTFDITAVYIGGRKAEKS